MDASPPLRDGDSLSPGRTRNQPVSKSSHVNPFKASAQFVVTNQALNKTINENGGSSSIKKSISPNKASMDFVQRASSTHNSFFNMNEKERMNQTTAFDFSGKKQPSHMHNVSVEDIVRSNLRKTTFGFDFYNPPKNENLLIPVKSFRFGKLRVSGFVESYTKSKAFVPAPNNYSTQTNWSNTLKGNKGKFLKNERLTVAGEIMKFKERATPSPAQYEQEVWKKFQRIRGNYKSNEQRGTFIEEARYHASSSPSSKYNLPDFVLPCPLTPSQDKYKDRIRFTKINPDKKKEDPSKIKKVKGPCPGHYEVEKAINQTQWITRKCVLDRQKNASFIDQIQKQSKLVPGVGTYKELDSAYDKICISPSLKMKRH